MIAGRIDIRAFMRETSSHDFARWKAYAKMYGMPEGRADLRAAIVSRFAGMPHKEDVKDLLASRWIPLLSEEPESVRGEAKQSTAAMKAVLMRAIVSQTGAMPQEA